MGQVLHGSATTTEAVRRAIQHSQESLRALAKRYGVNPKTIAKWKARTSVSDLPTGPKAPRSTVLSVEEEAVVIAFRRHTLLPLDDCLYALQPTIPHLTRSSLHRCLQRHEISRLPQVEGEASAKRKFKAYPIGYFHINIAEVRTPHARQYELGGAGHQGRPEGWRARLGARLRIRLRPERHRSPADKAQASMDQWASRKNEPHYQGRDCQTLLLRDPRPTASPPAKLRRRLQLRQAAQNPQGPHPIRIHPQRLEFRATPIQNQPAPANAGTKHLGQSGGVKGRRLIPRKYKLLDLL